MSKDTEELNCPICRLNASDEGGSGDWHELDCCNCGRFSITWRAASHMDTLLANDDTKRSLLSHTIWTMQSGGSHARISLSNAEILMLGVAPSISEQANNLLSELAQSGGGPGVEVIVEDIKEWTGRTGANSAHAILALFEYLHASKYIKPEGHTHSSYKYSVTVLGWQYYEELQKQSKDSTQAFMAMQFGDAELDKVVDETFRSAVAQTGFRLTKLNDEQRAGLIDDQLRVQIRRSRFLIADLTHANNGAYWEAGFAEGLGIPVIYTCKQSVFDNEKTKPHFDTNHYLTVIWNPEKPEEAAEKLKATIRATLPEAAKMEDT